MTSKLPSDAESSRAELGRTEVGARPQMGTEAGGVARMEAVPEHDDASANEAVPSHHRVREADRRLVWYVAIGAACASLISFLTYSHRGDILLFGDAVAHINIARRVFDSRTPGPLQLGTVWLPLPHLLIMPFVVSRG